MINKTHAIVRNEIIFDKSLTSTEKVALIIIENSADENGYLPLSNKALADIVGFGEYSSQKTIRTLKRKGFISCFYDESNNRTVKVLKRDQK